MKKILFIAGTRPEAIKLAPLYLEMRRRSRFDPVFCATGQHPDLMDGALEAFDLKPDITLESPGKNSGPANIMAIVLRNVSALMGKVSPAAVLVQGDTTSACAGAWAAFLSKSPLMHIEAGLRTHNVDNPFPEEANRRAISLLATWHAAPTVAARDNLLSEKIDSSSIRVTGNTAIDALFHVKQRLEDTRHKVSGRQTSILVTCHRRENLGEGLRNICLAAKNLARNFPDVQINWVLHPNPAAAQPARELLGDNPNIALISPLSYPAFVQEMLKSRFIISDSGGIQEEAPALGIPVLVTRPYTERPEAVELGVNRLVGTDPEQILTTATKLLTDPVFYAGMARVASPYGDGTASQQICNWLETLL